MEKCLNMVVAINNFTPNTPSLANYSKIEYLDYDADSGISIARIASNIKDCYDEVYVLQFDPFNKDFIEAIREAGTRIV